MGASAPTPDFRRSQFNKKMPVTDMPDQIDLAAVWKKTSQKLRRSLGAPTFDSWIAPLQVMGFDGGVLMLSSPSMFHRDWVNTHFQDHILGALRDESFRVLKLDIRIGDVGETAPPSDVEPAAPAIQHQSEPVERDRTGEDLPSSPLDARFTFDRFVVGKPNELAHAAARRVAESTDAAFNPLFLYGGVGLGKTHLMHAIAWQLRWDQPSRKVLYLSAEQFMYRFVQALRFKDTLSFKQLFRAVDVLMIDDVQFIAGKDATQEEFFHTFNALIDQNKQIVISADRSPGDIDGLEERIRSRLQWGLVVDIHPTNYELRLGILQSKAEALLSAHSDIQMDPKVLNFLAARISSNVRVLEGALQRLVAFADLVGRPIDMDMVHESLSDQLKEASRKVTIDTIKRQVCEHFNVRMTDMDSPRRARAVARPRQVAMYLAKRLTTKSLPEIGRNFGGRDHTTVIHAVRKIEQLAESDAALAEELEILRRNLEG